MIKSQDVGIKIKEGKPLGFPSADELIEYSESGEDKKNALEYEKAYVALIEQVKDKSHEEQVKFLVSHMNELRGMIDLFSFCRDEELFPESLLKEEPNANDEILANLMIYRYENNISILDDEYCTQTEDYVREIRSGIYKRRSKEKREALDKLKKNILKNIRLFVKKDVAFQWNWQKTLELTQNSIRRRRWKDY